VLTEAAGIDQTSSPCTVDTDKCLIFRRTP
jgi:hypothetical protein